MNIINRLILFLLFLDCFNTDIMGQSIDLSIERAKSLSTMADFYCTAKNYEKAISLEKQSLEIREKLYGNHNMIYDISVSNLAWYYYLSGDYKNAVKYGEENVKLWKELVESSHPEYPGHLSDLAEYHRKNGSYQKSIVYQKEVIKLYEKMFGEDIQHYAESLSRLSSSYAEIGDFSNSASTAEKAIDVFRKNGSNKDINYISLLRLLASIYLGTGNQTKALRIDEEIGSVTAEVYGKDNSNYARALSDLGVAYVNTDAKKALEYTKEALRIYNNSKERNDTILGFLLDNVSYCYSSIEDYASSIKYSIERIKLLDEKDISYSRCLRDIAKSFAKMKDYSKASEYTCLSLHSIRKMISCNNDDADTYRQFLFWNATHTLEELVSYAVHNATDTIVSDLYDEIINTRNIRMPNGKNEWYSWKDIKMHIEKDEVAIEFVNYHSESNVYIYALVLKKDMICPKMIKITDNNEFIDSMSRATSNHDRDFKLGQIIWGRLVKELHGVRNIYFTPTWTFVEMPIEYFPINEKHYYIDVYNIYRLSSTKELIERDLYDSTYSNAVLYGGLTYEEESNGTNSDFRSGYEPLFNTKIEIDEISDVLKGVGVKTTKLYGENGTERSLRNLSGGNTDILHIATHGIYDKSTYNEIYEGGIPSLIPHYNPNDDTHSNSFLVMSGANHISSEAIQDRENDGLLRSNEVSLLDFHSVKLLVMSACESGRGNYGTDDMLWGLQRGFKESGVKSILMSLNKVDDVATRFLMVEFYKSLMGGKTKYQSFRDAQENLRKVEKGKYDDPKYWASFIMLDGLN